MKLAQYIIASPFILTGAALIKIGAGLLIVGSWMIDLDWRAAMRDK